MPEVTEVEIDGVLYWQYEDGTRIPVVEGQDPPEHPPAETPPGAPTDRTPTREDIERLNRENAKHRLEAKRAKEAAEKAQAELKARQDAEKSELDRERDRTAELQNQNEAATRKLRKAMLVTAVSNPALGVAPDAIDLVAEKLDVEFDDNDQPQGVKEAVEAFLDERPSLKAKAASPSSPGHNPANPGHQRDPGGGNGSKLTDEQWMKLAETDPDKWNEAFDKGEIPASALS